jgi:DNA mismatch repair protein MutS
MKIEDTQKIQQMIACLNDAIRTAGGDPSGDYVKLHETEKSSMTLQITKTRGKILKKVLEEGQKKETQATGLSDPNKLRYSEISLKPVNASTDEIRILFQLKTKINDVILREYSNFLNVFEQNCFVCLDLIAKYIAKLDILQSKVYVAKEYNYCRPQIAGATIVDGNTPDKSFVQAEGLRHCLIEQIQRSEIYVANDLTLGAFGAPDGILLFGTNAVGKTSIIRALGIAVIMAQCGMFVPCQRFVYSPYSAIYSRILGNDNIFKGLSTFAVEMTELRMILNTADANSLILGDELCSGTETESALSIFMAGLMDLHAKRSSFFFATHFHEILRFDEMRALPRVALKHMSVLYDRERDCLVYDRKLADGAGNRMYGLEVCKSLHLSQSFLEQAYQIRSKYFPNTKGELEHTETKYHSAKIKGLCELCLTNIGEDVHHLQEQHLANENGYIGHFHKNHPANLMVLCETCHHKIHHSTLSSPPKPPTETTAPANATEKPKRIYRKKTTVGKMIV